MTGSRRPTAWTVAEALGLAAFLAVSLSGFTSFLDLHLTDEAAYAERGQRIWAGRLSADWVIWSPLYSTALGAIDRSLADSPLFAQDLMFVFVSAAAVLALWWALRGMVGATPAFLAAAWFASSDQILGTGIGARCNLYLFNATIVFLSYGCFARQRHRVGLLLLLMAALNRAELLPWLLSVAAVCAWRGTHRRWALACAVAAVTFAGFLALHPLGKARAWMNFTQHYAWTRNADADPSVLVVDVAQSDRVVAEDFPGVSSVGEAIASKPDLIFEHVAKNAAVLPDAVVTSIGDPLPHLLPDGVALGISVALAALGLITLKGRRPPRTVVLVAVLSLAVVPLVLFLRPRADVFSALLPPILASGAALVAGGWEILSRIARVRAPAWLPAVLLIAVAALLPRPFPDGSDRAMPFREAAPLMRDLAPGRRVIGTFASRLRVVTRTGGRALDLHVDQGPEPADARPRDLFFVYSYDLVLANPLRQRWLNDLDTSRWKLVHGGHTVWVLERVP